MLVILPPSETKRDGGAGRSLLIENLRFAGLAPIRENLVHQLVELAGDADASVRALKLGPRQRGEIERNRSLRSAAVMPAVDRYTGVLYDALDSSSLVPAQRQFAHNHVLIHSALFGPVAALDEIPAYRLSHSSRLPGGALKKQWGDSIKHELSRIDGLVLDLRSEGYAALGALEPSPERLFVRVVARGRDGQTRALNHFNKKSKGLFTRAFLQSQPVIDTVAELRSWAVSAGFELGEPTAEHEVVLIAPSPAHALVAS